MPRGLLRACSGYSVIYFRYALVYSERSLKHPLSMLFLASSECKLACPEKLNIQSGRSDSKYIRAYSEYSLSLLEHVFILVSVYWNIMRVFSEDARAYSEYSRALSECMQHFLKAYYVLC